MNPNEFERRMRKGECYHALRMPPGVWAVLRVDGRGFSRLTERHFEKPFDPRFRVHMLAAAQALLTELKGVYAYAESDEISMLLPREWDLFDREIEKAVSLAAGTASAAFTHSFGQVAIFDARVWIGGADSAVVDYFRWRQFDATRCCLNGWCYWTLRNEGESVEAATKAMEGKSGSWKQEMLFERGINFNDLPIWQRRGTGISYSEIERSGTDPRTGQEVSVRRREMRVDDELPMGDDYGEYVRRFL